MRKIPTLYRRNPDDRAHVIVGEVTPGCEWVLAGEGVPTRKFDGTCVKHSEGAGWWARREVKSDKRAPAGFLLEQSDEVTGKSVGWEPIDSSPFVKFFREALVDGESHFPPGTYELCGPKINGNPENYSRHLLISHSEATGIDPCGWDVSTPLAAIATAQRARWEGIVWHHPDGRMAKLKVRDMEARVALHAGS